MKITNVFKVLILKAVSYYADNHYFKMKSFIHFLLLFLFISCSNSKKNEIQLIHLEHTEINIPPEDIKDPHGLLLAGDNKFIILNGQTDIFFDLIDLTHGKCISFGIKGRGPGEMLSAVSPSFNFSNRSLNSYDIMKGDYNSISLNDINKGQNNSKSLFIVDRSEGWPIQFVPFNKSYFIVTGTFKHGRFGLFSNKGKLLYTFGDFPDSEFNREMSNIQLADGYDGKICSHPSKPLFVTVIPKSDLIEIYEKKGDSFLRINPNYQPEFPPCFEVFRMGKHWSTAACKGSIIGFMGCAVSNKFIFSVFGKGKLNDLLNNKINYPNIMQVYNWQGKHITNLSFDFPIVLYTVKRDGNIHIIYAIVEDDKNETNSLRMVKYEVKL